MHLTNIRAVQRLWCEMKMGLPRRQTREGVLLPWATGLCDPDGTKAAETIGPLWQLHLVCLQWFRKATDATLSTTSNKVTRLSEEKGSILVYSFPAAG